MTFEQNLKKINDAMARWDNLEHAIKSRHLEIRQDCQTAIEQSKEAQKSLLEMLNA